MNATNQGTVDAMQSVIVAACAHMTAEGPCGNLGDDYDPEYQPYCDDDAGCTYCALARACDALPEEMKP